MTSERRAKVAGYLITAIVVIVGAAAILPH